MGKLDDLDIEDFILLLLNGIKQQQSKLQSLTGRTMVQKVIYLLTKGTQLRESWGLKYRIHHYGPYSPEVTKASENLITFGLVEEHPQEHEDLTRYDLQITSEGEVRAEKLLAKLDQSSTRQLNQMIVETDALNRTYLPLVVSKAYKQARVEGLIKTRS